MNVYDIAGRTFGYYTVIERIMDGKYGHSGWKVRCVCGKEKSLRGSMLVQGVVVSCGCKTVRAPRNEDLTGQKFGRWTALEYVRKNNVSQSKRNCWICKCDCGTIRSLAKRLLTASISRSCGCWRKEIDANRMLKMGRANRNARLTSYKLSAKKRNLEWNLSEADFDRLTSSDCHYCGQAPSNSSHMRRTNGAFHYNGIDRKDSSLGYFSTNVVPACFICNRAKTDIPYEKFMQWIQRLQLFKLEVAA